MAEDRYRLGPLREVRERAEVVRRGDLAAAIGDAEVTAAHLADRRARTTAARDALTSALASRPPLATATELALADRFIARRRKQLADALDEELRSQLAHDRRTGEVELARGQLVRARADRELIERHFARWREDRRKRAENAAD
ncbi:MAG: hypothetical protein ABI591_14345 [Kofleriaceae bacterium]